MPTITRCRIASDVDHLSQIQLEEVSQELKKHHPKLAVETVTDGSVITSNGTQPPNSRARIVSLMKTLLGEAFDALVIEAKFLPARLPNGLTIGAITSRRTPYDVLVSTMDCILDELPDEASLVANDVRRESQLLYYRPDLKMVRARGSVDSIIQKVKSGKVDAAVLAAGDVERLQKQDLVAEFLTCSICIPAAGQGSLAVIVRSDEEQAKKSIRAINDRASYSEIVAEWAFLDNLGIPVDAPVGVLGSIEGTRLELEGMIAVPDGRERIHSVVRGKLGHEVELGKKLAREIFDAGGATLLKGLKLL